MEKCASDFAHLLLTMAHHGVRLRNYELSMTDRAPIAAEFEECSQLFQLLCSAIEANPRIWKAYHLTVVDHRDALAAWGAETGATSYVLDHALRKSSTLQQHVLELLQDCSGDLQRSKLIRWGVRRSLLTTYKIRPIPS